MPKQTSNPSTKRLCACNCGSYVTRKTEANHLSGKHTPARVKLARAEHAIKQAAKAAKSAKRKANALLQEGRRLAQSTIRRSQSTQPASSPPPLPPAIFGSPERDFHNSDARMDSPEPPEPAPAVLQTVKAAQAVEQAFQRWTDNHRHTVVESDDEHPPEEGDSDMETCSSDEDSDFDDLSDDGTESVQDLEAMIDELAQEITEEELEVLRMIELKLEDNLTDRSFDKLAWVFQQKGLPSFKVARKRVEFLAKVKAQRYDCCINVCICYTGPHETKTECPFCKEPRLKSDGKPQKTFTYIPLIPRLAALFQDPKMIDLMSYRHNYKPRNNIIQDIFDGSVYSELKGKNVTIGGVDMGHKFFDGANDIALGLATDGFAPFKRPTFKDLDHGDHDYHVPKTVWDAIGEATKASKATIPAAYGAAPPDPTEERSQMTADNWSFWIQYLGPIFLERAFTNQSFYRHFVDLVKLMNLCLQFEITKDDIQRIREGFQAWVTEYERLYYQHNLDRVSACPVTIHALLHIADGIEAMGPVWAYWAFPIERFCGKLGRTIKSRRNPYKNLDNRLLLLVQMTQLKNTYHLEDQLRLGPPKQEFGKNEVPIPNPLYSSYRLVYPRRKEPQISPGAMSKILAALATRYSPPFGNPLQVSTVRKHVINAPIEIWGKLRRLEGGDLMHASQVVSARADDRRDASYVRYDLWVDKHAHSKKRRPVFVYKHFYGQLQYLYRIQVPAVPEFGLSEPEVVVLGSVKRCRITRSHGELDIHFYKDDAETDYVDIAAIQCLVGRVSWRNKWAIFDRSGMLGRAEPEASEAEQTVG
ncbi:hypothetical protein H1R20_g12985, partial [Candolleomyces eurysporus]